MKPRPEDKLHAIPRFPPISFAVHIGDHLRLGIICGPIWGSFATLYGATKRFFSTAKCNKEVILEASAKDDHAEIEFAQNSFI